MAKLDLLFLASNDSKNPHPPIAHIYVKEWGTQDYMGYEETILVSPQCLNFKEVDEAISSLIQDLEAIRAKARVKFKR